MEYVRYAVPCTKILVLSCMRLECGLISALRYRSGDAASIFVHLFQMICHIRALRRRTQRSNGLTEEDVAGGG